MNKNTFNVGEMITGMLSAAPNTQCTIYQKEGVGNWQIVGTIMTNSQGSYTASLPAEQPGDYSIAVACGSCTTNTESITINPIQNPSQDSDGDSFTDQQEQQQGTDPNDPSDHPNSITCLPTCTAAGYTTARGPFSGSSFCYSTEVARDYGSDVCCCGPVQESDNPTPQQECDTYSSVNGYDYVQYDINFDYNDCYSYANTACANNGESLVSIHWESDLDCCVWICDTPPDDIPRTDDQCYYFCQEYNANFDSGDAAYQGEYCHDSTALVEDCCCWSTEALPSMDDCETYCVDQGYNMGGYPGQCMQFYDNEMRLAVGLNCCCVWEVPGT
jgi:hypothetical protein